MSSGVVLVNHRQNVLRDNGFDRLPHAHVVEAVVERNGHRHHLPALARPAADDGPH